MIALCLSGCLSALGLLTLCQIAAKPWSKCVPDLHRIILAVWMYNIMIYYKD